MIHVLALVLLIFQYMAIWITFGWLGVGIFLLGLFVLRSMHRARLVNSILARRR